MDIYPNMVLEASMTDGGNIYGGGAAPTLLSKLISSVLVLKHALCRIQFLMCSQLSVLLLLLLRLHRIPRLVRAHAQWPAQLPSCPSQAVVDSLHVEAIIAACLLLRQ